MKINDSEVTAVMCANGNLAKEWSRVADAGL